MIDWHNIILSQKIFLEKFEKALDKHIKMCYNNLTEGGVIKLNDKIKELIKIVGNLNKLMLKVIELAGTITLLVLAVKSIFDVL